MKYINTKTGAVVESATEVKGGDWVEVATSPVKKRATKKAVKPDEKLRDSK